MMTDRFKFRRRASLGAGVLLLAAGFAMRFADIRLSELALGAGSALVGVWLILRN